MWHNQCNIARMKKGKKDSPKMYFSIHFLDVVLLLLVPTLSNQTENLNRLDVVKIQRALSVLCVVALNGGQKEQSCWREKGNTPVILSRIGMSFLAPSARSLSQIFITRNPAKGCRKWRVEAGKADRQPLNCCPHTSKKGNRKNRGTWTTHYCR